MIFKQLHTTRIFMSKFNVDYQINIVLSTRISDIVKNMTEAYLISSHNF